MNHENSATKNTTEKNEAGHATGEITAPQCECADVRFVGWEPVCKKCGSKMVKDGKNCPSCGGDGEICWDDPLTGWTEELCHQCGGSGSSYKHA